MSRGAALAIMLAVLAAIAVSAVALGSSHQSENEYAVTYELDGGDLVGDAPGSYKPGKYVGSFRGGSRTRTSPCRSGPYCPRAKVI